MPSQALRAQFEIKSRAPPPADPEEIKQLKAELDQVKGENKSIGEEKAALEKEVGFTIDACIRHTRRHACSTRPSPPSAAPIE